MEKDKREILKSPFSLVGFVFKIFLVEKNKKSDLFSLSLSFFDKGKRDIRYPHRKISSAEQRERKLKW